MDRIIEVKVNGNYATKDSRIAGVKGEANVTKLRIEFDEGWDGYAKKVVFWDAYGKNPVTRTLTADLMENGAQSTRVYLCPIPGEPLAEAGECEFVIEGYLEGKRQRSAGDTLLVKDAPYTDAETEPADPTPTQAEQLQEQIDKIADDVKKAAEGAYASDEAKTAAAAAAESARQAADSAINAAKDANDAELSAFNARLYADDAKGYARISEEAYGKAPFIVGKNWWEWNKEQNSFVDTGVQAMGENGKDGKDGSSVTMDVIYQSDMSGGNTILRFTDKDGYEDVNVWNGKDGKNAEILGVSVNISEDGTSAAPYCRVETEGTSNQQRYTFNFKNLKGNAGIDGYTPVKGKDYTDGEDGYTPVKGVDYFDGKDGHSIYYSTEGFESRRTTPGGDTCSLSNSSIELGGRELAVGDMIVTADGYSLRVTVVGDGAFSAVRLAHIKPAATYYSSFGDAVWAEGTSLPVDINTISLGDKIISVGDLLVTAKGFLARVTEKGNGFVFAECLCNIAGKDGKDGKDGVDGEDGYTPVKGVDYYTVEEKNELIQEIVGEASGRGVGEDVSGEEFTIDGETVIAGTGAERFNSYDRNIASGQFSHAEGIETTASGNFSHAEGVGTIASGGNGSHAEGNNTTASGACAHAEGDTTVASGARSHAEGSETTASGVNSHAEGWDTTASGQCSHAEGYNTTASGHNAHAEGTGTIASSSDQHVEGKYNIADKGDRYAHIVGNGTDNEHRSNAHTVDWEGRGWFAGEVEADGFLGNKMTFITPGGRRWTASVSDDGVLNGVTVPGSGGGGGGVDLADYAKKDELKTINGQSIVGSGNIEVGGGGVSSWNDLTDKPFGEETSTVEVLAETALIVDTDLAEGFIFKNPITLEAEKNYNINYNGVSYSCVANELAMDGMRAITLGNMSAMGGEDSGEPFAMLVFPAEVAQNTGFYMQVMPLDGSTSVTISIYQDNTIIHPLDNKYLDLDWLPTSKLEVGEALYEGVADTYLDAANGAFFWGPDKGGFGLVPNTTYIVKIGDIEYEALCKTTFDDNGDMAVYLGDIYTFTNGTIGTHPTGENFAIYDAVRNTGTGEVDGVLIALAIGFDKGSAHIPIEIRSIHRDVNKLPGEYLPKGTPWIEENGVLMAESYATGITHPTFGKMWVIYGGAPNLTVGETYTITYNGVDYKCLCQAAPSGLVADPNAVAMGNFVPVGGPNTGEPFAMLVSYAGQEVDIIDLVGSASVKVGIKGAVAHKVDARCLPGSVFTVYFTVDEDKNVTASHTHEEVFAKMNDPNIAVRAIATFSDNSTIFAPLVACAQNEQNEMMYFSAVNWVNKVMAYTFMWESTGEIIYIVNA